MSTHECPEWDYLPIKTGSVEEESCECAPIRLRWVSVKESLPRKGEQVFVYLREIHPLGFFFGGPMTNYALGSIKDNNKFDWDKAGYEVTHWMHMPPAPKNSVVEISGALTLKEKTNKRKKKADKPKELEHK
jgi:hypothetical protein